MVGKEIDIEETGILIFNVEDTKWAKPEHILKWDFLPNSTRIPLANDKALKLLEEVAPGQFQAIPAELRMPDGSIIKDYKLINIICPVEAIEYDKCPLKPEKFRTEANKHEEYYYKRDCLKDNIQIAVEKTRPVFLASEKLKKAIKSNNITGMVFKDTYAGCHKFIEE
ncbi:hypothetical protein I862_01970 [endosymbiont of Acanthamoeba sp. UWC8]|nr:hypothetical protein I862_01970 [endosymbiont of Acanthamoeba sp. UWC8]